MTRMASLGAALRWHYLLLVVLAGLTAGCDLWTKHWATTSLSESDSNAGPVCAVGSQRYQRQPSRVIEIVPGLFDLRYAENCGGAWSVMAHTDNAIRVPMFALINLLAMGFLLYIHRSTQAQLLVFRFGPPLILGGAIGNLTDRLRRGYVVDFAHAHWHGRYHYPVFNVADVAIGVGIGLLVLATMVRPATRVA